MALLAMMGLFIYQSQLVMKHQRETYFLAFLSNNWVGAVLFMGILSAV
jgi:4-hydroxybenzoate polyprenyltransferase